MKIMGFKFIDSLNPFFGRQRKTKIANDPIVTILVSIVGVWVDCFEITVFKMIARQRHCQKVIFQGQIYLSIPKFERCNRWSLEMDK